MAKTKVARSRGRKLSDTRRRTIAVSVLEEVIVQAAREDEDEVLKGAKAGIAAITFFAPGTIEDRDTVVNVRKEA